VRRLILSAILALAACGGAPLAPAPPGVTLWEANDHTTEGEVTVPGAPAANYAAVGDYARWPAIFSDVARVEDQGLDPATGEEKVLLVTKEGQNNNLRFKNDPAHRIVRFHDTGGSADVWAEIAFEDAHGSTRVRARLHADVHGFISLFVTNNRLRDQRRKKLSADLASIRAFFTPPKP
jgi:hypothetical protein